MANIVRNRVIVTDASSEEIIKIFDMFKQYISWENTIKQIDNTLLFETAWSALHKTSLKHISFSANRDAKIQYTYAEENHEPFQGQGDYIFKEGNIIFEEVPDNDSIRSWEIFFEMWPGWKGLYIFDGTTYQRDWDKE
jgi:hypothetical protein